MDGVSEQKSYLFLQGPHGPFMGKLAGHLMQDGHTAHRIHFNGGDWIDWPHAGADHYRGSLDEWPRYLQECISRYKITDIVLYSYWRPVHKMAMDMARRQGIRVHGFEEGLLRPHWVTLSPHLPCEQAQKLKKEVIACSHSSNQATERPPVITGDNYGSMLLWCYRYYTAYFLLSPFYWRHRTHRGRVPFVDMWKWVWHFFVYPWRKHESHRRVINILKSRIPFFLLCLQLDGDSQIRQYSEFRGMADVMETVIRSFANHAPAGARLVIKRHPLDNQGPQHEHICRMLARRYGVENDVVFVPYGKLVPLLKRAAGVVTVNSSAGFSALYHGCPLKSLGDAAYNIPGLANIGPLDSFWQNPEKPDEAVYEAMQTALHQTTQYPGGFYASDAQDVLISFCLSDISRSMDDSTVDDARMTA